MVGHDRFLPGLEKLVKTVEKASGGETRLLIQVIDFLVVRRRPDPEKYIRKYLEISDHYREELGAIPDEEIRDTLLAMTDEERAKVMTSRDFESLQQGFRERVTDIEQDHIRDLPTTLPGIFAQAAGRALVENTDMDAPTIAEKAMHIAADTCIYTNHHITFEVLDNV